MRIQIKLIALANDNRIKKCKHQLTSLVIISQAISRVRLSYRYNKLR